MLRDGADIGFAHLEIGEWSDDSPLLGRLQTGAIIGLVIVVGTRCDGIESVVVGPGSDGLVEGRFAMKASIGTIPNVIGTLNFGGLYLFMADPDRLGDANGILSIGLWNRGADPGPGHRAITQRSVGGGGDDGAVDSARKGDDTGWELG